MSNFKQQMPMATLGSDRLITRINTGGSLRTSALYTSSNLATPISMRSEAHNTQSMQLTPRSPDPTRPNSASQSTLGIPPRPQTNTNSTSNRLPHRAGSASNPNCAGEGDGGPEPPVRSASTSSSMLDYSVPVPTPTESVGERSGPAGLSCFYPICVPDLCSWHLCGLCDLLSGSTQRYLTAQRSFICSSGLIICI
jgi:hypothetical protein